MSIPSCSSLYWYESTVPSLLLFVTELAAGPDSTWAAKRHLMLQNNFIAFNPSLSSSSAGQTRPCHGTAPCTGQTPLPSPCTGDWADGDSHYVPSHVWGDKLMVFPENPKFHHYRENPWAVAGLKEGASSRMLGEKKEGQVVEGSVPLCFKKSFFNTVS